MSERVWSSAAITTVNILSSKRWCRSVGTRIIRLHRGYSPHNASCNLPRLWPGDAELLFVLYHLFSKHIKGKAEINPRTPQQSKDKKMENYQPYSTYSTHSTQSYFITQYAKSRQRHKLYYSDTKLLQV